MAAEALVVGPLALVRSCHPGPTLAVTLLAALLAVAYDVGAGRAAILVVAVVTGQLVIGWSNDLIDADRDRNSHRLDKPLATGAIEGRTVTLALVLALAVCLGASLWLGWRPGLVHVVLVVGSGVAYNLGLKATPWSFVPYVLAFGSLPAVAWLARTGQESLPPAWMLSVGALLGLGAHLLNVLPDLSEDERLGVRGLPHRLGLRRTQLLAPVLLAAGTTIVVLAPAGPVRWWGWVALAACGALALVAWQGSGKTPFRAALALAVLTALSLLLGS